MATYLILSLTSVSDHFMNLAINLLVIYAVTCLLGFLVCSKKKICLWCFFLLNEQIEK